MEPSLYPEIPGFQIIEIMPHAGMSKVYKARQLSLDRVVVLKVLPQSMVKDRSDIERFAEEARITAQLKHSNIVQIYDFASTPNGIYYFVMEFVSGYSMGDWIRRKGRLTEENALLCTQCVAVAMNYAWERARVVHCDIKPDNIMIDGDGTVKVADLGLARSLILSRKAQEGEDMVYGTPNYISPEQAKGEQDIDCRSDIYSLGATLYHAATGIMPFEEKQNSDVMELQVTSYIPDAIDVNPSLSIATACLIEKMMAKHRRYRYRNWDELIKDIVRARSEKIPFGKMPADGTSTVLRNKVRQEFIANLEKTRAQKEILPKRSSTVLIKPSRSRSAITNAEIKRGVFLFKSSKEFILFGALLMVFIIGAILFSEAFSKRGAKAERAIVFEGVEESSNVSVQVVAATSSLKKVDLSSTDKVPQNVPVNIENREESARLAFEAALEWVRTHTNDFEGAILRFHKISEDTRGTKYSILALAELDKIKERKEKARCAVISILNSNAALLEVQCQYDKAIMLLKNYNGAFARETESERFDQIKKLEEKKRQWVERQAEIQKRMEEALIETSDILLRGDMTNALNRVRTFLEENKIDLAQKRVQEVAALIRSLSGMEETIAKSFLENRNKDIKVKFVKGEELMFIRDVDGNKVTAEKVNVIDAGRISRSANFKVSEISLEEKLARLSYTNKIEMAFNRSFLFMQHNEYEKAMEEIAVLPDWLATPIRKSFTEYRRRATENKAQQELCKILCAYRLASTNFSTNVYESINMLRSAKLASTHLVLLNKAITNWAQRYPQCSITKAFSPFIEELKNFGANTNMEAEPKLVKEEEMESTKQENKAPTSSTEDFLNRLIKSNPSMSMENIKISLDDERKIRIMEIMFKDLEDISPLADLTSLKELVIVPGYYKNTEEYDYGSTMPLSDISALKGLNLRQLVIRHSSIKDISALKGMPLEVLDLSFSGVSDITPLQNMPLQRLVLKGTQITTLESLRNLPLEVLDVSFTKIKKIDVLAGMPLKKLNIRKTGVEELSCLLQTPIEELFIDFNIDEFMKGYNNELRKLIRKSDSLKFINGRPIPPDRIFKR
jgi:serine/threonine-protein kinase